jgi:hypothetical protein
MRRGSVGRLRSCDGGLFGSGVTAGMNAEKDISVLKICSNFVGGFSQVGFNPDRTEESVHVVMHIAQEQQEGKIWRRFGDGSDRNRALLGNGGNSMQDMGSRHRPFKNRK